MRMKEMMCKMKVERRKQIKGKGEKIALLGPKEGTTETDVGRNRDAHLFESFEAHAHTPVTKTRGCERRKCAR